MAVSYRSRVDSWLVLPTLAMPLVLIAVLVGVSRGALGRWPIVLLAAATLLISWIFLSTYYELDHHELIAHTGPFRWHVPLQAIRSVARSRSSRSGPALSMDRLEIHYDVNRVLLISPADEQGFLQLLYRWAPHLAAAGPVTRPADSDPTPP